MRSKTVRGKHCDWTEVVCIERRSKRIRLGFNNGWLLHTPHEARQIADALNQMADEIDGEKT